MKQKTQFPWQEVRITVAKVEAKGTIGTKKKQCLDTLWTLRHARAGGLRSLTVQIHGDNTN